MVPRRLEWLTHLHSYLYLEGAAVSSPTMNYLPPRKQAQQGRLIWVKTSHVCFAVAAVAILASSICKETLYSFSKLEISLWYRALFRRQLCALLPLNTRLLPVDAVGHSILRKSFEGPKKVKDMERGCMTSECFK